MTISFLDLRGKDAWMVRVLQLALLTAASMCAVNAAAQSNARPAPVFGPLAPADLRAIQGVGRAVLAAHKGASTDPDDTALQSDLEQMGEALTPVIPTTAPRLQVITGNARATPEAQPSARADRDARIQRRLAGMRQRIDGLKASPRPRDANRSARTAELLSKATALQDEVGDALRQPPNERDATLAKLRERLRPKQLPEVLAEREAAARAAGEPIPEPTPTISTIARHR